MAHGGARNRSGPPADPGSGRSDARGYTLTALPSEGFRGRVPKFPLPTATPRELVAWREAWRTPQACAWSMPSERWRWQTVAMWVRVKVRCEEPDAPASLFAQLHRFADQVGMTTAGLAEMGWKVAVDELAVRAAEKPAASAEPRARRLRSAGAE